MARTQDPTEPIRTQAAAFPGVAKGTSCNQSSFKAGKGSFLFIGPGAKGQGFKALSPTYPTYMWSLAEESRRESPCGDSSISSPWFPTLHLACGG